MGGSELSQAVVSIKSSNDTENLYDSGASHDCHNDKSILENSQFKCHKTDVSLAGGNNTISASECREWKEVVGMGGDNLISEGKSVEYGGFSVVHVPSSFGQSLFNF